MSSQLGLTLCRQRPRSQPSNWTNTHSLTHLLSPSTHSLTHSLTQSVTHSLTHYNSLTCACTYIHTHTNSPTITPPSLLYFFFPSCFSVLSLSLEKLVTCGDIRSYNLGNILLTSSFQFSFKSWNGSFHSISSARQEPKLEVKEAKDRSNKSQVHVKPSSLQPFPQT